MSSVFRHELYAGNSRYKDEDLRFNSEEPMRLSISIDSRELEQLCIGSLASTKFLMTGLLKSSIESGWKRVLPSTCIGPMVPMDPSSAFSKVLPRYNKDALYPARNPPEMYIGSGPELHVYTLGIEGPFYEEWPPPGFDRFFPVPTGRLDKQYLRDSLTRLANAAFRRPVTKDEIQPYLDLTEQYLESKKDFWAAARYGVRAILTSPRFIYLVENAPHPAGQWLDGYELAFVFHIFFGAPCPMKNYVPLLLQVAWELRMG